MKEATDLGDEDNDPGKSGLHASNNVPFDCIQNSNGILYHFPVSCNSKSCLALPPDPSSSPSVSSSLPYATGASLSASPATSSAVDSKLSGSCSLVIQRPSVLTKKCRRHCPCVCLCGCGISRKKNPFDTLVRQMRPEMVLERGPLSSDAFSPFGRMYEDGAENDRLVREGMHTFQLPRGEKNSTHLANPSTRYLHLCIVNVKIPTTHF